MNCKNCSAQLQGPFCSKCGQKYISERITFRYIFSSLFIILTNVERGFLHTIKMLFVAPGRVIRDYIGGITKPYFHPLRYIIIWAAISTFMVLYFDFLDTQTQEINELLNVPQSEQALQFQQQFQDMIKKGFNVFILLIIPFFAKATHWIFRKRGLNYAEFLVAYSFIFGQSMLMGLVPYALLFFFPISYHWLPVMGMTISITYFSFVFRNLFQISWVEAIIKSILSLILGYLFFFIVIAIISFIAGLIYALSFGGAG